MNLRTFTTRAAVAGVTTALAAAGLVGATGTAANAVSDTTSYACSIPGFGSLGDFSLTVDTPVIPSTATSGQSFGPGLLALTATMVIPSPYGAALAGYQVDHADSSDYAVQLGATSIGADLAFEAPTVNEDGSATMLGGGANDAFTIPTAGTYDAMLPGTFTLNTELTLAAGQDPTPVTITCTTETPGDLGSVVVTKGGSVMTGKSKSGKVTITLDRPFDDVAPAGKVVAKLGKKTWTEKLVKKGKVSTAVFALPASAKGKKVTFTYKGDKYTSAADPLKVLVK